MTEFVVLRRKTYAYLIHGYNNDDYEKDKIINKKAKGAKKCVKKQKLIFGNYKDCLFNNKTIYRSHKRFKSYYQNMYTEEVNKISLSSKKNNKKLQTFDRITTYPYETDKMMIINIKKDKL